MKTILCGFAAVCMLTGCAAMPAFFQAAEEVLDDDAVKIVISREAVAQKDSDIHVSADLVRKDPMPEHSQPAPVVQP